MRILTIIIVGLTILSCKLNDSKNELSKAITDQTYEPNYRVAVKFINDYLDFSNDLKSEVGLIEWVSHRDDVSVAFTTELNLILKEAEKNDPELGLGFDPILDAQDNPDKFELDKTDSEYLIVRGVKWTDFKLTLKLKLLENKWLVDGAGIINIPKNKRIKR